MKNRSSKLVKLLDFYVGVLFVCFFRFFKWRKKSLPKRIQSIGLLKTAAIGDTVLITAILQDLRNTFPKSKIFLFCGKDNAVIAPYISSINQHIVLPVKRPFSAIREIRKYSVDVLIDCGSWPRIDSLITFFSKAKFKIGFKTRGQYRHYLYDSAVVHSSCIHELDNYSRLLHTLGVKGKSLPQIISEDVSLKGVLQGKPYCVFHLKASGCNHERRELPFGKWLEIAKNLIDKGFVVYLTGSQDDYEYNQNFITYSELDLFIYNIAGLSTFSQTLKILKDSLVVVSVNTGIMHVAAALTCKVISLNGPTSIHRWGGVGENVVNIVSHSPNAGFLNLGFEYNQGPKDTMNYIDEREVIEAIDSILRDKHKE